MSDDKENVDSKLTKKDNGNTSSDNEVVFYDNKKKYVYFQQEEKTRQTSPSSSKSPDKKPQQQKPEEKRRIPRKRLIINISTIFLSSLFIISGIVLLVVYYMFTARINYQAIDNSVPESSTVSKVSAQESTGKEQSMDTYEGELLNDRQVLNILLIGADTRYNQTSGNSDTMILISIDTKNKKLKLLSFMRDTYVNIPGYGNTKLTHSFSYGGAELTVRTIQLNYGIQIDRYAIVDFNSFKNIIDKLGGIDIELSQEEVDYIDWRIQEMSLMHTATPTLLTMKAWKSQPYTSTGVRHCGTQETEVKRVFAAVTIMSVQNVRGMLSPL